MSDKSKEERRRAALDAAKERTLAHIYSLSLMLLRAEAAFDKYQEQMSKVVNSGMSDAQLVAEVNPHIERVENNALLRASALLTVHLGLLYTVVEAWRHWKFFDVVIDEMLKSANVQALQKHRHSIFHPDLVTDEGFLRHLAGDEQVAWSRKLSREFRRALRDWFQNLPQRIGEHIQRLPI